MSATHTPGPWHGSPGSMGQGLIIQENGGRTIAVAYDERDMPVLAAAPELLKELAEMVRIAKLVQRHVNYGSDDFEILFECGCCGSYHFPEYRGDCRNDDERFPSRDPFEEAVERAEAAIAKATGKD